jgi:DNA-binding NtrC family response regulator
MSQNTPRQTVLLIDHEQSWLLFAQTALAEAGYQAASANTAEAAWRYIQDEKVALILMDEQVAEAEDQAAKAIIAAQLPGNYHVVIVSPLSLTPVKMRAMFKLGVYDCVEKPYDQAGLCKLVAEQLAEWTQAAVPAPGD